MTPLDYIKYNLSNFSKKNPDIIFYYKNLDDMHIIYIEHSNICTDYAQILDWKYYFMDEFLDKYEYEDIVFLTKDSVADFDITDSKFKLSKGAIISHESATSDKILEGTPCLYFGGSYSEFTNKFGMDNCMWVEKGTHVYRPTRNNSNTRRIPMSKIRFDSNSLGAVIELVKGKTDYIRNV